jgi:hypothetical protein
MAVEALIQATGEELCARLFYYWSDKREGYDDVLRLIADPSCTDPSSAAPSSAAHPKTGRTLIYSPDSYDAQLYGKFPADLVPHCKRPALAILNRLAIPDDFLAFFRASVCKWWITPLPILPLLDTGSFEIARVVQEGLTYLLQDGNPYPDIYVFLHTIAGPAVFYLTQKTAAAKHVDRVVTDCHILMRKGDHNLTRREEVTHMMTTPASISRPRELDPEYDADAYADECKDRFLKGSRHDIVTRVDSFLILFSLLREIGAAGVMQMLKDPVVISL